MDKHICGHSCTDPERTDHAKAAMPEEELLYDLSDFFKIFGDSTRIKILFALDGGRSQSALPDAGHWESYSSSFFCVTTEFVC